MIILYSLISILLTVFIVYMLLIMPNTTKKGDTDKFNDFLYAHRGFHDNKSDAPENSLLSFTNAVEKGYGMELDIQLTKDNKVVVFHDFTLKRVCNQEGKVIDFTYDEIKEFKLLESNQTIPLLEDVLKEVNGKTPLIVEFKVQDANLVPILCQKADEILSSYNGLYCMESFNPAAVIWYKENRPEVVRGQLSCNYGEYGKGDFKFTALEYLLMNFKAKPDFVAYDKNGYNNISRKICRNFYKNTAAVWTLYTQEDYDNAKPHFDLFIFEGFEPK